MRDEKFEKSTDFKSKRSNCSGDSSDKRRSKSKDSNRARRRSARDSKGSSRRRDMRDEAFRNSDRNGNFGATSGLNDFSWYSRYPVLTQTAASFPYPYRPGMDLNFGTFKGNFNTTTVSTYDNTSFHIPGVLQIGWIPSVGQSTLPTDPASIVGKEAYAAVRKVFSGSLDADAPDFVMYLLALDSIYAYIGACKRVYRALVAWSPNNFQVPDVLLEALGVSDTSAKSLRVARANLLYVINELIYQSRKFRCPAIMDLFNRHYWLNDNVYTDANTINSQLYVFKQNAYFKLNPNAAIPGESSLTAAGLTLESTPFSLGNGAITPTVLYDFGISLIQALDQWDDGYTISGYLMKAFDGTPSFDVAELSDSEILTPLYVEEVLSQIENARTAFGQIDYKDCQVYQDPSTNAVISQPICTVSSGAAYNVDRSLPPILSIRSDSPTVEENVIASRLQTITSTTAITPIISGTNSSGYPMFSGTEIVENFSLYGSTDVANSSVSIRSVFGVSSSYMNQTFTQNLPKFLAITQFDWHPILWMMYMSSASSARWIPIGDVHNATVIERAQMQQLNRVCLFSEFGSFINNP